MKVLLSLKPTYADQILAGTKKFEFRRRIFRDPDASDVVMYVTKPVGHVVGEFKIKKIHHGHPDALWLFTEPHAGISKKKYQEYFDGRSEGYAIEISEVVTYKHPKPISEVIPSGKAPQSFAYLKTSGEHVPQLSREPVTESVPHSRRLFHGPRRRTSGNLA
jgi:predicted transcriptional regulator